VRDPREASLAWEGGASYIDIKEPSHGPLGSASPAVQAAIVTAIESMAGVSSVIVTAALGELATRPDPGDFVPLQGISLYKLGLSGYGTECGWQAGLDAWRQCLASRPDSSSREADLVAVAYADHRLAASPEPQQVLQYAVEHGLSYFLLDTFEKGTGSLLDFCSIADLRVLADRARRHGVNIVLAGSLRAEDFQLLSALGPDVLAVRGAACREGKRELGLDPDRVRELVRMLRPTSAR